MNNQYILIGGIAAIAFLILVIPSFLLLNFAIKSMRTTTDNNDAPTKKSKINLFSIGEDKSLLQVIGILFGMSCQIYLFMISGHPLAVPACVALLGIAGIGLFMGGKPTFYIGLQMVFLLCYLYIIFIQPTRGGQLIGSIMEHSLVNIENRVSGKYVPTPKATKESVAKTKTYTFTGIGDTGGLDGKGGIETLQGGNHVKYGQKVYVDGAQTSWDYKYQSLSSFVNKGRGTGWIYMRADKGQKFTVTTVL